MKEPKVTVLMSVYNGEKYLREAIDSILNQTFTDFEFLIINDGSTDKTQDILNSYNDTRIKIINNEENIGLTKSLNKGLRLSRGKYIARQDADDISLPERLEKELQAIESSKEIGAVSCWIKIVNENTGEISFWPSDMENNSPEEIYYTLFFENCIAHSTVLFCKDIVLKIGGYSNRFEKSQDYDLWIRLSQVAKIVKLKENLVIRREHEENTSLDTISLHKIIEERLFLENIRNILPDKATPNHLLFIKYYNANTIWKFNKYHIYFLLKLLNEINSKIVQNAPNFLNKKILNKCTNLKRKELIKNSFPSFSRILKYIIKIFLFIPKYILDYSIFFFTFKRKIFNLKVIKGKSNILCIIPFMVIGGAERVILNISQGIDHKSMAFHCITTNPENHVWKNKFLNNFENVIIPNKLIQNENILFKYLDLLIRKLNIDIVLTSNSSTGYRYLPRLKSEFIHTKTIDILHARESFGITPEFNYIIPYLDRRICISKDLKEYMMKIYEICNFKEKYGERIRIIYNGIDTDFFNPAKKNKGVFKSKHKINQNTKLISFIGRFSSEKNPLLFVDIAQGVIEKNQRNNLRFVMSGNGLELERIREHIRNINLEEYFILTDFIDDTTEIELLADTFVLLVVSQNEGIPFVILEAISTGIPVISTNVGAIKEIIKDDENGYLIKINKEVIESFSNKVSYLLQNQAKYDEISKNTQKFIHSKYTLKNMGEKYKTLFNEISMSNLKNSLS